MSFFLKWVTGTLIALAGCILFGVVLIAFAWALTHFVAFLLNPSITGMVIIVLALCVVLGFHYAACMTVSKDDLPKEYREDE